MKQLLIDAAVVTFWPIVLVGAAIALACLK